MKEDKSGSLRSAMPRVARLIDEKRQAWGAAHVNDCIKAGVAGEPDQFWAVEAGIQAGTPFSVGKDFEHYAKVAQMVGGAFMVMREPKGLINGKD
jgi:hypothetical protein